MYSQIEHTFRVLEHKPTFMLLITHSSSREAQKNDKMWHSPHSLIEGKK